MGTEWVVIGGGPGGLGAAAALGRAGVRATVLERGDGPAARWRERYDRLRINTSALTAFPPGGRFPLRLGRWPSRDQLVGHYERYVVARGIELRTGVTAARVDREGEGWVVRTDAGDLPAAGVVVATGKDHVPEIPDWEGEFGGELVHVAGYRTPAPFAGRRVLVVGAGSSAVDVCLDLVEGGARTVHMAVRTPPHLMRRSVAGVPADLTMLALHRAPRPVVDRIAAAVRSRALPAPPDGLTERVLEKGMIPTIDPGGFACAVRRGAVEVVPALERLDGDAALLAGGRRLPVDAIIAATGYRRGLEPLVGHLGVLDGRGHPRAAGAGTLPHAPRLHFVGYTDVLTGNLRQMRLEAEAIAAVACRT